MTRALIFGVGGQDGSYLAELLLAEGYEVHGFYRRSSADNLWRIAGVRDLLELHQGDLLDQESVREAVYRSRPGEVYNLADQDDVRWSFKMPDYSMRVTFLGLHNILRAVETHAAKARVFQALSATMFGSSEPPQNEGTALDPCSPYAVAKAASWHLCRWYRKRGIDVRCAIFFNHDSPRRGPGYLLQKIARGEKLDGDLEALVDVGYAPEYAEAAWRIMQLNRPDDFVVGTGKPYKIRDLVEGTPKLASGDKGLVADCRKAKMAFGLNLKHDAWSTLQLIKESLK